MNRQIKYPIRELSQHPQGVKLFADSGEKARQTILSILRHVCGQHEFPELPLFPACQHGELKRKKWIKPGIKALC